MTLLLAFVQLLLIVYIALQEYYRKSPAVFLWSMLFVVFGVPHFLSSIFQIYNYDLWVYQKASYFVIVFSMLYYITRLFRRKKITFSKKEFVLKKKSTILYLRIIIFLLILNSLYDVYTTYMFSGSLFNTSWSSMRELSASQGYVSIMSVTALFYFALSSCLFLALALKKKSYVRCSFIILLLGVLLTRNRVQVLPLIVSFAWLIILKGKKVTAKFVILSSLIALISVYVVYGLLLFRYAGTIDMFLSDFSFESFNADIVNHILSGKGEMGLREAFYYFIANDNEFRGFGCASTYIRMLLIFVPTSYSFGMKPEDFAIVMGSAWNPGIEGFSMHPTLFGDCYANLGFFGVSLGFFWGVFMNISDNLINRMNSYLKYSLLVTFSCCFIIIGRGSVYNGFAFMFYGGLLLSLISFFVHRIYK